jgi:hypothetical protein
MGKLLVLLFIIALSWGCQNSPTPLSDAEKEDIKQEVKAAFEQTTAAVNIHDADKIMQACWNNEEYFYAANGTLMEGWKANHDAALSIHSNPKNQSFTLDYDAIIVKVLNQDAAMLVAKGAFNHILTEDGTESVDLVVTFLMEKIDNKWLITIGHESTGKSILIF